MSQAVEEKTAVVEPMSLTTATSTHSPAGEHSEHAEATDAFATNNAEATGAEATGAEATGAEATGAEATGASAEMTAEEVREEMHTNISTIHNFDEMGLKDALLRGVLSLGFEKPSVVQCTAIPAFINHKRDVIAQAQSGTGKTATFSISLLQCIDADRRELQAIILAPTRELAIQIHSVISDLSRYMKIDVVLLSGGQNVYQCRDEVARRRPAIVVGTPGRTLHFLRVSYLDPRNVQFMVLDEADQLLSYDFQDQVRSIFGFLPESVRVALYTATISAEMEEVTKSIMKNPIQIRVPTEELTLEGIKQFKIELERESWKFGVLMDIFGSISVYQMMIYCNRKERVMEVRSQLSEAGMPCECIHSQLSYMERNDVMKKFRSGDARVLVTTDLLCRGIDVQQVSLIINYDFPRQTESYLHRIGRSGRFGRKGYAINFITPYDRDYVHQVTTFYQTDIAELPSDVGAALS